MYRWDRILGLLLLRLVSFNLDSHWAYFARANGTEKELARTPRASLATSLEYEIAVQTHRPQADYNFVGLYGYCTYAPLWTAGPTITYNAFASQITKPQTSVSKKNIAMYALRVLFMMAMMEVMLNYYVFFALGQSQVYKYLTNILSIICMVLVTLFLIWTKFTCIWRTSRLWALSDGIEVPENQTRCVFNCTSLSGFWRGWHVSFNKWIVRYLYIPLGGKSTRVMTVWPVFLFVALWHDNNSQLLYWGILNASWMGLEISVQSLWRQYGIRDSPLEILGAGFDVAGVIFINFLGYAYGTNGAESLSSKFASFSWEHLAYLAYVLTLLSSTAHIGFALEKCGWTNTPSHKPKAAFNIRAAIFFASALIFGCGAFYMWFPMVFMAAFGNSTAM